jgi:predicted nucleotidyltransferase
MMSTSFIRAIPTTYATYAGGGSYEDLLAFSEELALFGVHCRFVTLERLIQLKRAAGRPKDLEIIAELQALLEERRRQP